MGIRQARADSSSDPLKMSISWGLGVRGLRSGSGTEGVPPTVPRLDFEGPSGSGGFGLTGFGVHPREIPEQGLSAEVRKELAARGPEVVPKERGTHEFGGSSVPSQDMRFQTPRSSVPERASWGVNAHGYPVSPGGSLIRPPPVPPPLDLNEPPQPPVSRNHSPGPYAPLKTNVLRNLPNIFTRSQSLPPRPLTFLRHLWELDSPSPPSAGRIKPLSLYLVG